MSVTELSSQSLVNLIEDGNGNEDIFEEVYRRSLDPALHAEINLAWENLYGSFTPDAQNRQSSTNGAHAADKGEWQNCIGQQKCRPQNIEKVFNLQDLVKAVNEGQSKKLPVRAVGSGHSFSNVCPTDGILLDPAGMCKFLEVNSAVLKDPSMAPSLVSVESGITIEQLNKTLHERKPPVALATMGAYDGQTLVGAISTGTHGSMTQLGPLGSLVRSLTLVTETGAVYLIEPSDGITDPSKYSSAKDTIVLKQDDDIFNSALMAMGCMGLIYSYTIDVVPAFLLSETRAVTSWQDLKPQLTKGLSSPLVQKQEYFEIDINPYETGGKNAAILVTRKIVPRDTKISIIRGPANFFAALGELLRNAIIHKFNNHPEQIPAAITTALKFLKNHNYVNESYKVFNLGAANRVKAYAVELSFDANQDIVQLVDRVIKVCQDAIVTNKFYLAGPIACRFTSPSSAYVAPQQGRTTMMVEFDMLYGINNGDDVLKHLTKTLCFGSGAPGVRVHWGLDLDVVNKDNVAGTLPLWQKWVSVYKLFNTTGIWNSVFTDRLGITVKPNTE